MAHKCCCKPPRRGHEPKPYCTGVGCTKDFHQHPATFMGSDVAAIQFRWGTPLDSRQQGMIRPESIPTGRARPEEDFPVGSQWHYGPIYENMETRVEVIEPPKRSHDLRDYSLGYKPGGGRRGGSAYVEGPKSWFVKCRVISSPYREPGSVTELPPCALIPAAAVDAERAPRCCCCCCASDPRDTRIAQLEAEAARLRRERDTARLRMKNAEDRLDAMRRKVEAALR